MARVKGYGFVLFAGLMLIAAGCGGGQTSSQKAPRRGLASNATCTGHLNNILAPGISWTLQSAEKKAEDSWTIGPYGSGPIGTIWQSTSGFLRGCSNTVRFSARIGEPGTFGSQSGTIEVNISTPQDAANNRSCTTTGPFTCVLDQSSTLGGYDQNVSYVVGCTPSYLCAFAPRPKP
jgi:hypothetical protein